MNWFMYLDTNKIEQAYMKLMDEDLETSEEAEWQYDCWNILERYLENNMDYNHRLLDWLLRLQYIQLACDHSPLYTVSEIRKNCP